MRNFGSWIPAITSRKFAGALLATTPVAAGSRRAWLLGALRVSAAPTGLVGVASSLPAFLALRFAGGAASAFVLVFASALVLDRLALLGRQTLSAVHFAGVGIGITVSAAPVSIALAAGAGWRELWYAGGAISLAALVIAVPLFPAAAEPAGGTSTPANDRGPAAADADHCR